VFFFDRRAQAESPGGMTFVGRKIKSPEVMLGSFLSASSSL